ncbi:MAG: hypothetical protein RLZZ385_620 [Pseudomonadota bacterium]|jgi:REP element-mobilizing transposase RayT
MTRARNQQVSLEATPYYHCISRCVRRAYLCGEDVVSGHNFDHRKVWVVEKIKELAGVFAIDVCAYAIMSNHYHLVLYVNQAAADGWSDEEVIRRWTRVFTNSAALLKTVENNPESKAVQQHYSKTVKLWRERLSDISWFMRCLNECIARRANREDDCTGRFWEGRFKSQALLDEKALVTCMAYVDLNPVRAGLSASPEESDFTSIQERLVAHARRVKHKSSRQRRMVQHFSAYHERKLSQGSARTRLLSLNGDILTPDQHSLPLSQQDYFTLLQWSAEQIRNKSTTATESAAAQKVLQQLAVDGKGWLESVTRFQQCFYLAAGGRDVLEKFHRRRAKVHVLKHKDKWIRGAGPAVRLFGT